MRNGRRQITVEGSAGQRKASTNNTNRNLLFSHKGHDIPQRSFFLMKSRSAAFSSSFSARSLLRDGLRKALRTEKSAQFVPILRSQASLPDQKKKRKENRLRLNTAFANDKTLMSRDHIFCKRQKRKSFWLPKESE